MEGGRGQSPLLAEKERGDGKVHRNQVAIDIFGMSLNITTHHCCAVVVLEQGPIYQRALVSMVWYNSTAIPKEATKQYVRNRFHFS